MTGQGNDTLINIENVTAPTRRHDHRRRRQQRLDGGAGIDTSGSYGVDAAVTVNLAKGNATGQGSDTLRNIRSNRRIRSLDDTITGSAGDNVIGIRRCGHRYRPVRRRRRGGDSQFRHRRRNRTRQRYAAQHRERCLIEASDHTITGNAGNNVIDGGWAIYTIHGDAGVNTVAFNRLSSRR